ncbi:MAG: AAA family ATPase [Phycisphaerae bacterium]|nr:AAA family ATPase [Phycisphaerae bacterium]
MDEIAKLYLRASLAVLPAKRSEKRPAIGSWKKYQQSLPTANEIDAWFSNSQDGICIITGKVSGNLEIIDFDNGGELFDTWIQLIPKELARQLVIESTPSGGYHVVYRCEDAIDGNMKLAQRRADNKVQTLIETRGEGGLFLCAPTGGYELMQGRFDNIAVLTSKQREQLLEAAEALNEYETETVLSPAPSVITDSSFRPGDDFNKRGDIAGILRDHGWVYVATYGINQRWRRPGKPKGWSADLRIADNVFYVFSSNADPFESNKSYSPFMTYAILECNGDLSQAAAQLAKEGYGDSLEVNNDNVDISGIINQKSKKSDKIFPDDPDDWLVYTPEQKREILNRFKPKTWAQRNAEFTGLNKPIIYGLLREGETMNIIASPKVGKSWLASSLALSIISGRDWMGFNVEQGNVLHIDNELHENTSTWRYGQVAKAMDIDKSLCERKMTTVSLRGKLANLNDLGKLFAVYQPGEFKLVIIDAFYRTLPVGTDENDNAAIANLYNNIDRYAAHLDCGFILIHHSSKGNQANKSVTDVGAGAGSQSRATDTHLVLRPHEQADTVVMDAAVRSWAPVEPIALSWQWPIFSRNDDVDVSALLGAMKTDAPKRDVSLDEFVESCVSIHDPCTQSLINHEAKRQHDISRRKAKEMVQEAIDNGKLIEFKFGSKTKYVKVRGEFKGGKGQLAAAILTKDLNANDQTIAEQIDSTSQYVGQIRRKLQGDY